VQLHYTQQCLLLGRNCLHVCACAALHSSTGRVCSAAAEYKWHQLIRHKSEPRPGRWCHDQLTLSTTTFLPSFRRRKPSLSTTSGFSWFSAEPAAATPRHGRTASRLTRGLQICSSKLAFHDANTDTDTDILARIVAIMSAYRLVCHRNNFRKSRVSDVSARMLARMSLSVSVSMSAIAHCSANRPHDVKQKDCPVFGGIILHAASRVWKAKMHHRARFRHSRDIAIFLAFSRCAILDLFGAHLVDSQRRVFGGLYRCVQNLAAIDAAVSII